jgi:endonuclease III
VLLSAQATDVSVNKATRRAVRAGPDAAEACWRWAGAVTEHIRTIGLYRTKAKNLLETCRILVEQHGGEVPRTREALEALPGVGRKTANVVLNVAFGEPTMAVDTHIFRVANRTGLAPGARRWKSNSAAAARTPSAGSSHAHHWLILHGRYVCWHARHVRPARCAAGAHGTRRGDGQPALYNAPLGRRRA